MRLRCSILIQKRVYKNVLFLAIGIAFSALIFQISTANLLLKIQKLKFSYLGKELRYTNTF